MADLAIALKTSSMNPVLGDLELDATGSEVLLTDDPSFDESRAIMQDVFIRLRFFYGEWFLDPSQGVPYFKYVLVHNPDLKLVESIFRRVVLGTPGIASLDSFTLTLDRAARIIYPTFVARMTSGKVFTSSDFGAFVVPV